jgi:AGCS family alanine or glycine:cation symporter
MYMDFTSLVNVVMGWPLIVLAVGAGIVCTLAFKCVQIRYFADAWRYFFAPGEQGKAAHADMSPAQALINALNSNLGNGTIAGMAVALATGGPGAVFWLLVIGLLLMAVRFAEVFLSSYFGAQVTCASRVGGPMLYLAHVPGGRYLPYMYAFACLIYGLLGANGAQTNSIALSITRMYDISNYTIGFFIFIFVVYVVSGGAERILNASQKIVPVKVGLFAVSTVVILIYHHSAIIPSLRLVVASAFSSGAVVGGLIGFSVQQAMRVGISRIVMASEAGIGTTAIMFGSTCSVSPVKDAIMSMLSTCITTVIAFVMALCIVISGVWNSGQTSTALTMAAFHTVFGNYGDWIVIFLAASFGLGAVVAFAYVARETWIFLTKGSYMWLFAALYCLVAFGGCVADVDLVWKAVDLFTFILLAINLYGIMYLLPLIRRELIKFMSTSHKV